METQDQSWQRFVQLDSSVTFDTLPAEFVAVHVHELLRLVAAWDDRRLAAKLSECGGWDAISPKLVACSQHGNWVEWLSLSIRIASLLLGERHHEIARLRVSLAYALVRDGRDPALAREQLALALPILEAQEPGDRDLESAYRFLASHSASIDERIRWLRTLIEAQERAHGPFHTKVALYTQDLAGCFEAKGVQDEALALFARAVDIYRRNMIEERHTNDLVFVHDLAARYRKAGDQDRAAEYDQLALELKAQIDGPSKAATRPMTSKEVDDLLGFKE